MIPFVAPAFRISFFAVKITVPYLWTKNKMLVVATFFEPTLLLDCRLSNGALEHPSTQHEAESYFLMFKVLVWGLGGKGVSMEMLTKWTK